MSSKKEIDELRLAMKSAGALAVGWLGFGVLVVGGAINSEVMIGVGCAVAVLGFAGAWYWGNRGASKWWKEWFSGSSR